MEKTHVLLQIMVAKPIKAESQIECINNPHYVPRLVCGIRGY